jgi:hypothetical protein
MKSPARDGEIAGVRGSSPAAAGVMSRLAAGSGADCGLPTLRA